MNKIMALTITFLVIAGSLVAGYVEIRVAGSDAATYLASANDVLTIEVKVYGFSDQLIDTLGAMSFDVSEQLNGSAVAGVASDNLVRYGFDNSNAGSLENLDGILIRGANMSSFAVWANVDYNNRVLAYSFDYKVGDVEDSSVVISLAKQGSGLAMFRDTMGNDISAGVDVSSLTIVPEPLSIALLGLGGLFIRRTKA